MEFLKKNYEKVLLAVVLLILTAAACSLPFIISAKRAELENRVNLVPHPKELPKLDMTPDEAALQRAQTPLTLDFTTKHNLLNPVLWKKLPDGRLLKEQNGDEEGAGALVITAIKPLYLQITLGSPNGTGYFINIERQAALREDKRHLQSFLSKENNKTELVTLKDVKGPADKPTELDFEWNQTGESFSVLPDKPFRKVEAYAADLSYAPEHKNWTDRRVGSPALIFANGAYKIVAITDTNVVVSAESNKKKTTINFHPATEPR